MDMAFCEVDTHLEVSIPKPKSHVLFFIVELFIRSSLVLFAFHPFDWYDLVCFILGVYGACISISDGF